MSARNSTDSTYSTSCQDSPDSLDSTNSTDPTARSNQPTLDLTGGGRPGNQVPTIDLRGPVHPQTVPPTSSADVDFLAGVLVEQTIPPERPIDLTVSDLTAVDKPDRPSSKDRTWGAWGLHDDSDVGQVVSPSVVVAARRLYEMMNVARPLIGSPGTYHQTHRRFSADYVHRNIRPKDGAADPAFTHQLFAAQYRLAYFVGLPEAEFEACFRFTGEITRDYLLHCRRSDRRYAERTEPTPTTSASDRRKRKSRSLERL